MAHPGGKGSSKNPSTHMTPKHNPKAKVAHCHEHKTDRKTVLCFICSGLDYTRDCPPENWKAAWGYAVCIADEDVTEIMGDDASELHSARSQANPKDNTPPKSNKQDLGSKHSNHPEGEQYDPDDAGEYPSGSDDYSEPVYRWATQIVMTSTLKQLDSQAVKALKPAPPKAPVVESNHA